jgi:L-threonylcarbamoyladenylate synthase
MNICSIARDGADECIKQALAVLEAGGLVVYPTETTYGIGADAQNSQAVEKLITYKSKRDGKPLSVAVADQETAERYVKLNETARNLYKTFLPGPVTIVSTGTHIVAPGVESMSGTVGIRIPDYEFTLSLLRAYGKGITATGANASYMKRPYTIQDIFDSISQKQKDLIDLVIDAGELPHNDPSTVLDTVADDVEVLRVGQIHAKDSEEYVSMSVEETIVIAKKLMDKYRSKFTYQPLIIALSGQMGAGKTHFTKGLAQALRITEPITSPTFSLSIEHTFIHEEREGYFVHIDTWRLNGNEEFEALHIQELIDKHAVLAIEWADKVEETIQTLSETIPVVWVEITGGVGEQERRIRIIHPKA